MYTPFLVLHGLKSSLLSHHRDVLTFIHVLFGMVGWSSLTKGKKVLVIHSQKSLATIFGFPFTEELLQAQCHDNLHLNTCVTWYLTCFPPLSSLNSPPLHN